MPVHAPSVGGCAAQSNPAKWSENAKSYACARDFVDLAVVRSALMAQVDSSIDRGPTIVRTRAVLEIDREAAANGVHGVMLDRSTTTLT